MVTAKELELILKQALPWLRNGAHVAGVAAWLTPNKSDDLIVEKAKQILAIIERLAESPQSLALLANMLALFRSKLESPEPVGADAATAVYGDNDPVAAALRDTIMDVEIE